MDEFGFYETDLVPSQARFRSGDEYSLTQERSTQNQNPQTGFTVEEAKNYLARVGHKHDQSRNLVQFICHPPDNLPRHVALARVLEDLGSKAEHFTETAAAVFTVAQAEGLWKGAESVESAEAFIESLPHGPSLIAALAATSHTRQVKLRHVRSIAHTWGNDWFARILRYFPDTAEMPRDEWSCSTGLLAKISAVARAGTSLDVAATDSLARFTNRTDTFKRGQLRITGPSTLKLLPSDIKVGSRESRQETASLGTSRRVPPSLQSQPARDRPTTQPASSRPNNHGGTKHAREDDDEDEDSSDSEAPTKRRRPRAKAPSSAQPPPQSSVAASSVSPEEYELRQRCIARWGPGKISQDGDFWIVWGRKQIAYHLLDNLSADTDVSSETNEDREGPHLSHRVSPLRETSASPSNTHSPVVQDDDHRPAPDDDDVNAEPTTDKGSTSPAISSPRRRRKEEHNNLVVFSNGMRARSLLGDLDEWLAAEPLCGCKNCISRGTDLVKGLEELTDLAWSLKHAHSSSSVPDRNLGQTLRDIPGSLRLTEGEEEEVARAGDGAGFGLSSFPFLGTDLL